MRRRNTSTVKKEILASVPQRIPAGWEVVVHYDCTRALCRCQYHRFLGIPCTPVAVCKEGETRKKLTKGDLCRCLSCGKEWRYTGETYDAQPIDMSRRALAIRKRADALKQAGRL